MAHPAPGSGKWRQPFTDRGLVLISQRVSRSVHWLTRLETRWRINFVLTRLLRRSVRNWQAAFLLPLAHLCFGRFGLLRIQSAVASEIEGLRWEAESGPAR